MGEDGLEAGPDGRLRCSLGAGLDEEYRRYHDEEWGVPVVRTELAQTVESRALSRDLKRRGWTFVGPTTVYAFMQAMGLVNDHLEKCEFRVRIADLRAGFRRPRAD